MRSLDMALPGMSVSDVWFPPGAHLSAHTHERAIFAVALEGALDSRLPGHELRCGPAAVWTEPAQELHSNRIGPRGARVLALLVDPGAEELLHPCGRLLDEVHFRHHGGVASLARRILPELRVGDAPARLTVQALALETLALGLRSLIPAERGSTLPRWLAQARHIVHDDVDASLDLTAVAREVGVEPARLARAFRGRFQVPLGTYQRRLRLERAAETLATSSTPLARVALDAGFCDQAHFTRHFSRHFGQPPGRYRQSRRGRCGGNGATAADHI